MNYFYQSILKPILIKSSFGRACMEGKSNTGESFERMYDKVIMGDDLIGVIVDYFLLNLPAVEMARNRKENIKRIIEEHASKKDTIRVMDIASGASRYTVEAAASKSGKGIFAVCIDHDSTQIMIGKHLAEKKGVLNQLDYRVGDVFNRNVMEGINPDLTIISGLSVYHDDDHFSDFLKNLSDVIPNGSHIVIDNQIHNPSQKLMEKLAKTTYGGSWRLNYRQKDAMESMIQPFFKINKSYEDRISMIHTIEAEK